MGNLFIETKGRGRGTGAGLGIALAMLCIVIPGVYWSHTTKRVLALENVESIKITNFAAIAAASPAA